MTLQTFSFEGTDGATLSGTNISLGGSGTAVFSTSAAVVGGTGARFSATDGATRYASCDINDGKIQAIDVFLETPPTIPGAGAFWQMLVLRSSSGIILAVEYNSAQKINIYEQASASRNNIVTSPVSIPVSTKFRIQLLVNIGVAANDSSYTAKIFGGTPSDWSIQNGATLSRSGINLGTVNAELIWVGAVTAKTPGLQTAADYLRVDDGKTTDFTPPPAATAPTAVASFSDQYSEQGVPVNLLSSGSTAGSGSITGYLWECTYYKPGTTAPAITNPNSAVASYTPSVGSRYTFRLTITQTGGLTAFTDITHYPHAHSNADVGMFSETHDIGWTNEGSPPAASILAAVNDPSSSNYAQSPVGPTGQLLNCISDPCGPGALSCLVSGNWTGGVINRTVEVRLEDDVTVVTSQTYALTSVEVERELIFDAGDLAQATEGAGRRALHVRISDAL